MKLNVNLFFYYKGIKVYNPYCGFYRSEPPVNPLTEYKLTQEDLLRIFDSQEYLDWLKKVGHHCYEDLDGWDYD